MAQAVGTPQCGVYAAYFEHGRAANAERFLANAALESLLDGEAEALTRKAVEMALAGDMTALRVCMERIYPARKDTPVSFDLPVLETATDGPKAMAAIMTAVASGDLTPGEANELARLVDTFLRAVEAQDLDQRLRRLEAATR